MSSEPVSGFRKPGAAAVFTAYNSLGKKKPKQLWSWGWSLALISLDVFSICALLLLLMSPFFPFFSRDLWTRSAEVWNTLFGNPVCPAWRCWSHQKGTWEDPSGNSSAPETLNSCFRSGLKACPLRALKFPPSLKHKDLKVSLRPRLPRRTTLLFCPQLELLCSD